MRSTFSISTGSWGYLLTSVYLSPDFTALFPTLWYCFTVSGLTPGNRLYNWVYRSTQPPLSFWEAEILMHKMAFYSSSVPLNLSICCAGQLRVPSSLSSSFCFYAGTSRCPIRPQNGLSFNTPQEPETPCLETANTVLAQEYGCSGKTIQIGLCLFTLVLFHCVLQKRPGGIIWSPAGKKLNRKRVRVDLFIPLF